MARVRFITLLLLVSAPLLYCVHRDLLRVMYGTVERSGKYSYVVALVSDYYRECTGSFLKPEWVLTASHCIDCDSCHSTHVQYGDMTLLPNETQKKRKIIQKVRHPGFRVNELLHDIGLVRVNPLSMKQYGELSAVDYSSLNGLAVEYAGFGTTEYMGNDECRPLIFGHGVVISCLDYFSDDITPAPYICVAAKCDNRNGDSAPGDSGGPLFFDNKIVGVVCTGIAPIGFYTAISPYITWIADIVAHSKIDESFRSDRTWILK